MYHNVWIVDVYILIKIPTKSFAFAPSARVFLIDKEEIRFIRMKYCFFQKHTYNDKLTHFTTFFAIQFHFFECVVPQHKSMHAKRETRKRKTETQILKEFIHYFYLSTVLLYEHKRKHSKDIYLYLSTSKIYSGQLDAHFSLSSILSKCP